MKFYLISDNVDTLMGMHLAGIDGVVVHEEEEVRKTLSEAMNREDIAVILMTERLVSLCPELIYDLKLNRKQPLFGQFFLQQLKTLFQTPLTHRLHYLHCKRKFAPFSNFWYPTYYYPHTILKRHP